jgi:hypothetical protein
LAARAPAREGRINPVCRLAWLTGRQPEVNRYMLNHILVGIAEVDRSNAFYD